ncbi:MAG TPA: Hsp20/alpha crystallin family protein [Spirochaetales bacterium]|nr:Hsp20/alpha crystallin family protein [Spirochaetales bacterium]
MDLIKWRPSEVFDPMTELDRMREEFDRFFGLEPMISGLFDRVKSPAIDVVEQDDAFVVTCDLPGVDMKDLEVNIANNVLTIKGEKKDSREVKDSKVYRQESWFGSFQRTLSLPDIVDPDKIEAVMKDGVLKITLPKKEEVKPKQIAVKVS